MNREQLRKMPGKVVRIRPEARRFDWSGADLGVVDHLWRVVSSEDDTLELEYVKAGSNPTQRKLLIVPFDHVHDYKRDPHSEGFLVLLSEVQIVVDGSGGERFRVEPIHPVLRAASRPGPTTIYQLVKQRLASVELRDTVNVSDQGTVVQERPSTPPSKPAYTFSGVRELVRELDYTRLKKLADDHVPHVFVTLQWQAPEDPERESELRDAIGTIFGLGELGGLPVQRLRDKDIESYFRGTLTVMCDLKRLLWLDHGYATRVVDRSAPGHERIETDDNYHLQFRVRVEGKPVGVD